MTLILVSIFAGNLCAAADSAPAAFERANEAYRQGRYAQAAQGYEEVLAADPMNAAAHFNLGNATYRLGRTGAAILAYERAKRFSPRDGDIRYNLNYVTGLLPYRIEDKRNWYLRAFEIFLKYFTDREIEIGAAAAYFVFMLSWVFVIFFRSGTPWGWIRKTLLLATLISAAVLGLKKAQAHFFRDAIVVAKETQAHYGPSDSDQVAFRLGEGLKVYVVDRRTDWSRVLLTNGDSGWVPSAEITEI